MADANIKKVIIPSSDLFTAGISSERSDQSSDPQYATYLLRYRIVTEDKTKSSPWSQIYEVKGRTIPSILEGHDVQINTTSDDTTVTFSCVVPDLGLTSYDVYIWWYQDDTDLSEGSYEYAGSISATSTSSFSVLKRTDLSNNPIANKVKIRLQAPTNPKVITGAALIAEIDPAIDI